MGETRQPAFGSSTYDWVMRKGPGKYSADEWIDHLTSTRKVNFKIFGKPAQKTVRGPKDLNMTKDPLQEKKLMYPKKNCLILTLQPSMIWRSYWWFIRCS